MIHMLIGRKMPPLSTSNVFIAYSKDDWPAHRLEFYFGNGIHRAPMPSGAVVTRRLGDNGGLERSDSAIRRATGAGIRAQREYGKPDRAPMPLGAVVTRRLGDNRV